MKKLLTLFFYLTFFKLVNVTAQTLPDDYPIDISSGLSLVSSFQNLAGPANRHPSSFLLLAKDLQAYLLKTETPYNDCYLHIYFASKNADGSNAFLVIAGTVYLSEEIIHDPTAKQVLCTSIAEPNCGTVYDKNLDGGDRNAGDITLCTSVLVDKANGNLKTWIGNYQRNFPQGAAFPYDNTQSFLIAGDSFRDYLLDPNGTAKYIQFYIGYDPKNNSLNKDHLTIVAIGVDQNGVHIPSTNSDQSGSYVFDECIPCPKCYIDTDVFDVQQQFIGHNYIPFHVKASRRSSQKTKK